MSGVIEPSSESPRDRCSYPGCTRPLPDPATGRPTRYCGEPDEPGGQVHNRATAFKARRAQQGGGVLTEYESGVAAPVSMARATLDQRLAELPTRFADLCHYLDGVVAVIRDAGDIEAAGAEVEDAHRDALTKITEAEGRAVAAERAARAAGERADAAERDREEADLLAEDASTEAARIQAQARADIATVRTEADAAIGRSEQALAQAVAEHEAQLAERDADVERARQEASAAQVESSAAVAAQRAADAAAERERETVAQLRRELDEARREFDEARQHLQGELDSARGDAQRAAAETASVRVELATAQAGVQAAVRAAEVDRAAVVSLTGDLERQRAESQAEREALRQSHAEQLAQAHRSADERVSALNEALSVYRAQLAPPKAPRSPRKGTSASG